MDNSRLRSGARGYPAATTEGAPVPMVLLLPLVLALLAADPASTPTAPPSKLQEIGRVASLPTCTTIVVRANSAISEALANDSLLAILMTRWRNLDFDDASAIAKEQAINDCYEFAHRLRDGSTAGDTQVKKLRDLAAATKDPQRQKDLKAFADALGGALHRQQIAGIDLDRAVAVFAQRMGAIAADEGVAADHSLGAATGW